MDILPWMKGFGSEGSVLNLMLTAFIIWHVFLKPKLMKKQGKDRRKVGNPGIKPGDALICKETGKSIVKLETKVDNFSVWLTKLEANNNNAHEKLFDKIEKVRNNRK